MISLISLPKFKRYKNRWHGNWVHVFRVFLLAILPGFSCFKKSWGSMLVSCSNTRATKRYVLVKLWNVMPFSPELFSFSAAHQRRLWRTWGRGPGSVTVQRNWPSSANSCLMPRRYCSAFCTRTVWPYILSSVWIILDWMKVWWAITGILHITVPLSSPLSGPISLVPLG